MSRNYNFKRYQGHKRLARTAKLLICFMFGLYLFCIPATYIFVCCTSVVDEEKNPIRRLELEARISKRFKALEPKSNLNKHILAGNNKKYYAPKNTKDVLGTTRRLKIYRESKFFSA